MWNLKFNVNIKYFKVYFFYKSFNIRAITYNYGMDSLVYQLIFKENRDYEFVWSYLTL